MAITNNHLKTTGKSQLVKYLRKFLLVLPLVTIVTMNLISCASSEFGNVVLVKPDEYRHIYEASEKIILTATARVFKEKSMGSNIRIDRKKKLVETDYVVLGEWRTKSVAKVKKINWKEREVVVSVTTEKKKGDDWEMRRLLDTEQYVNLFDAIDLAIYEEMSKVE